jgi:S-DNA-T family DNA segregation ATPase FtsK/SpoIIIE
MPGEIPVGRMLPELLAICGPDPLDARQTNPALWALVLAKSDKLLDARQSLQDAGIGNGATLVLRNMSLAAQDHEKDLMVSRLDQITTRPLLLSEQASTPSPPQTSSQGLAQVFHIPVRDHPPRLPDEEIVINPPPQLPTGAGGGVVVLQLLLPVLGALGGSLFFLMYFVDGRSAGPWMFVIALAIPVISIVTAVATNLIQRRMAKKQRANARAAYLKYLNGWRIRLQEIAKLQRQVSQRLYPEAAVLAKNVTERKYLWERGAGDPDFLRVSIGQGPRPLCSPIRLNLGNDYMRQYEPELQRKAEELVAQYHHLDDEPVTISLQSMGLLAITGKNVMTRALGRAILSQVIAFHTPSDVRCIACFPSNAASEWSWLKWLPHTQRLRRVKASKQQEAEALCLLADNAEDCLELLETQIKPELELRRKFHADQNEDAARRTLPHLIFLLDGFTLGSELAKLPEIDELFRDASKLGVTILCIVDERSREPAGTQARISISDEKWLLFEVTKFAGQRMTSIVPNAANVQTCTHIARNLALLTLANDAAGEDLSQDIRLLDLLDIPTPEAIRPSLTWKQREREDVLRVPLGKHEKGKPLLLDLKEASEKGDGPHGLVVGATGSGKSELLRTLVISQAILHNPGEVNFVFVDFKGGASFADLAALPHVAGMITNLENELALIDRMYASLLGELRRRQRVLREAGNLDNIQQYRAKWLVNRDTMPPLPHLLIIVDEFAELLANRPDFLELFVAIGRVGRSLGLHLLLATQRLEEGRLRGLESHLRYRICLRTFSATESSTVLGKPDAYYLPSAPGIGYLKIDARTPQRFKTALISIPYVAASGQIKVADVLRELTPTGKTIPCQTLMRNNPTDKLVDVNHTEMDVAIARLAASGQTPVHQVWLPPLAKAIGLERLIDGKLPARLWQDLPSAGMLRVPVGLLDVPLEQAQEPLVLDFSGAGGHLAIVGAPQAGKSILLRTLLISFMLTHSPRDVQFYCIDLGGGQLRPLEALPHVGAVCTQSDREKIHLLIRLMQKVITDRQVLFRDHHIESMAMYRSRRQQGEFADFPFGDVFLVIDNLAQLRHDFEQIEPEIANLITTGLTYGIHIVLATNRWAEVRKQLLDNIGTRLELRLNDPIESVVDKKRAAELLMGAPGRGLTIDKLQFQACLPWIGGASVKSGHASQHMLDFLKVQARTWEGSVAFPVLVLPPQIKVQEMPRIAKPDIKGVAIGLEGFRLEPAYLDLLSHGPHFLVLGDPECGKTNFLRLLIHELMQRYTPEQVQIGAIECRATINLFDITESKYYLTYASMRMPSSLKESVECVTSKLKERTLPVSYQSIKELRNAKTWAGPHYFLLVDDYDAIASPAGSPLTPLRDLVVQARDVGFHIVLTRTITGMSSTSFEPLIKGLRETSSPGLIMSGDRMEGKLLHDQAATNQPPGRGYLVRRRHPPTLIQAALV